MRVRALARGLRGACGADDDRVHVLEVRRVALQVHEDRAAVGQHVGPLRAVVVLHVAGAALRDRRDRVEGRCALELGEDRVVGAAEVVREHVEPAAVRHADHDLAAAVRRRQVDELVDHRHRHVQALDRELLLAEVRLVHEALEGVHLDEAAEEPLLLVGRERVAELAGLDLLAQPAALAVRREVLDLVGDRAAVGLAQVRQRVGQRGAGDVHAQDARRDAAHDLAGQAQRLGIERRIALGLRAQRVQPRGQVAVGAVGLQERRRGLDGLQQLLVDLCRRTGATADLARRGGGRGRRGSGGRRAERDAQLGEEPVVEAVLALQELLDEREEPTRLRALDDAVVVRRGHRHDLLGADHRPDGAEADGVVDRAGRHDGALADHEPRDGGDGADAARVGQRDVRAGEVVGAQLVLARLADELAERAEELGERHAPRVADDRDHEGPRAVLLLDVDGDAEVHGGVVDAVRLAVDLGEVMRHHRHLLGRRAGDRVGDEVGEGHALARPPSAPCGGRPSS